MSTQETEFDRIKRLRKECAKEKNKLLKLFSESHTKEEIKDVCYYFDIDPENLKGEIKPTIAKSFIESLVVENQILKFRDYLKADESRRLIEWNQIDWSLVSNSKLNGIVWGELDSASVKQREDYKAKLIREMGSKHNHISDMAVIELRANGVDPEYGDNWLTDGSLRNKRFYKADLSRVDLSDADLTEANLMNAVLRGASLLNAILVDSKLSNADFRGRETALGYADLSKAYLDGANLHSASLISTKFDHSILHKAVFDEANLVGASFKNSDLTHATFEKSNLRNASFENAINATPRKLRTAKIIKGAIMPDGTLIEDWNAFEVWAR